MAGWWFAWRTVGIVMIWESKADPNHQHCGWARVTRCAGHKSCLLPKFSECWEGKTTLDIWAYQGPDCKLTPPVRRGTCDHLSPGCVASVTACSFCGGSVRLRMSVFTELKSLDVIFPCHPMMFEQCLIQSSLDVIGVRSFNEVKGWATKMSRNRSCNGFYSDLFHYITTVWLMVDEWSITITNNNKNMVN